MSNKIFFTADCHFGHEFISKKRGFDSVEEHDAFLIEQWNRTVNDGDRIYILGDFIFNTVEPEQYLKQLKGEKYLILGNHDRIGNHNEKSFLKYVHWIKDYFVLKIKNGDNIPSTKIVLCHYPFSVWDSDHYGSLNFFGHIHRECRHKPLQPLPNRCNVGVDVWNYMPVEYNEILEKLKDNGLYKKDYKEELKNADAEGVY